MEHFDIFEFARVLNSIGVNKPEKRMVYHYTGVEPLTKIITNKELWFTDRSFLNDRSEGMLPLEICEEVIREIDLEGNIKAALIKELKVKKDNLYKSTERVYVLSFSIDSDSLCLWNYYTKGDSVRGFNIGFMADELTSAFTPSGTISTVLRPIQRRVIYKRDEQKKWIDQTINKLLTAAKGEEITLSAQYIVDKIVYWGYFFKPECFNIEHEYRMVITWDINFPSEHYLLPKEEYRVNDGLIIPYRRLKFNNLDCIKSIMSSPTMDYELAEASLKRASAENPEICIMQSSIPIRY